MIFFVLKRSTIWLVCNIDVWLVDFFVFFKAHRTDVHIYVNVSSFSAHDTPLSALSQTLSSMFDHALGLRHNEKAI